MSGLEKFSNSTVYIIVNYCSMYEVTALESHISLDWFHWTVNGCLIFCVVRLITSNHWPVKDVKFLLLWLGLNKRLGWTQKRPPQFDLEKNRFTNQPTDHKSDAISYKWHLLHYWVFDASKNSFGKSHLPELWDLTGPHIWYKQKPQNVLICWLR